MIDQVLFNPKHPALREQNPTLWLNVAALLTSGYLLFGLVLIGVKGLTVGGIIFACLSSLWLLYGVVTKQAVLPKILLLPALYYLYMVFSGFQLPGYPMEYILRMTTIWLGAISIAAFIINGISVNLVAAGMLLVVIANLVAIGMGYDGRVVNIEGANVDDLARFEVERFSGLAGQQNLLISMVFTFLFYTFALRTRFPIAVYLGLVVIGIAFTVLTGSRSGIVFTAIFGLFGAVFLVNKGWLRTLFILGGIVVAIPTAVFFSSDDALVTIENSSYGELVIVQRIIARIDNEDASGEIRDAMKQDYWKYVANKPLTGQGPGMFAIISGFGTYAHNNFVEVLVNFGLLGLLAYYIMYIALFVGVFNNSGRNLAFTAPLVFLVMADNWFVTYVSRSMILCLCVLLAISFASDHSHRRKRRRRRRRRSWIE